MALKHLIIDYFIKLTRNFLVEIDPRQIHYAGYLGKLTVSGALRDLTMDNLNIFWKSAIKNQQKWYEKVPKQLLKKPGRQALQYSLLTQVPTLF
uniref:Uncharacterized protein n=1 Tax=Romanomermis culicivorax TaxID=13658 RepID=A0A915HLX1_ROMCU